MPGPWDKYAAPSTPAPAAADGPWSKYAQPAQGGGDPSTSNTGFIPSMQKSFDENTKTDPKEPLLETGLKSVAGAIGTPFVHPIQTLNGLGDLINPDVDKNPLVRMASGAKSDYGDGGLPYAATKMAGNAVGGMALGGAAGGAIDALPEASEVPSMAGNIKRQILPSSARAGQRFESIMSQAKDLPVQMTNTVPELQRANELVERGGTALKPITDLTNRINMISPPTYGELRDYYPNMSRLSADEANKLKPTMRRQVGSTSAAMNQDIRSALEPIGQADEYDKAMQEYGNAARNKSALKTAAKYGIAGAGLGVGGKILKDMIPNR